MKNIALKISYDGTDFFGWQKTNMGPSIEEVLYSKLFQILQEEISLQAASRTDRGVHAEEQVVNFITCRDVMVEELQRSLNALLPPTIRVLGIVEMPLDFHPTLDVQSKEYHYHLCLGAFQLPKYRFYSWHVPLTTELDEMKKGAEYLVGEHDFSSFCNVREDLSYPHKKRCIEVVDLIENEKDRLIFKIRGNHFLYKMVRNIVGTLVYVGQNKLKAEDIPVILASKSRPQAGITAPAHGLTLYRILYQKNVDLSYSFSL